ncbi:MAG: HAMP domain-containing histidine kinase, partial [Oligoflexia bacterium]|nr:HAMP domain-containing histidine kinase [Oligoflexia bacterium]
YSIRAARTGEDEMAQLIDSFNGMLAEVEQHHRDRERLLQEARDAVRVRDDFMSIASHELRTPLTPLKVQLQMIQRLAEKDLLATYPKEQLNKLVGLTDRQLARLSTLIDDLLDITRIASGRFELRPEEVRLGALVQDVTSRYLPHMPMPTPVVNLALNDTATGRWDRLRIEQVVMNLLSNALKYGDGKPVEISTRTERDKAVLTVQDHGMGIAPEDQERIFNRFERAVSSQHFGGLGLGLYITRQIVQAHEGTIRVESELGKGSRFIVELPLSAELPRAREAPGPATQ